MNRALTMAHIEGQARIRRALAFAIERTWRSMPGYDRVDVPQFVDRAVPFVIGAQRQSVAFTEAYLARALRRAAFNLDPDLLTGAAVRNGTPPADVYARPFVTLWTALREGKTFADASSAALARATGTAMMDVSLSMRATLQAVGQADDAIMGFRRVADGGACLFCQEVDGAQFRTEDPMPLHNNCGCGAEPVEYTRGQSFKPSSPPDTVAIEQHGEVGPLLADPAQTFTHI